MKRSKLPNKRAAELPLSHSESVAGAPPTLSATATLLLAVLFLILIWLAADILSGYFGVLCYYQSSWVERQPQPQSLGVAAAPPASRALAVQLTSQCGEVYAAAMPEGTIFGGAHSPPFSRLYCPDIENAIAGAKRLPSVVPLHKRTFNDRTAEGALLLPSNCSLRWFPPHEACALMPSMLVLVGDSLSRHLSFAVRQVLSGNYVSGHLLGTVVPADDPANGLFFPKDFYPLCTCNEAYRICAHLHPPPSIHRWTSVCPNWAAANASHLPPLQLLSC